MRLLGKTLVVVGLLVVGIGLGVGFDRGNDSRGKEKRKAATPE